MPLFRMPLGNAGSGACWLPLGFRWRGGKRGNRAGTLLVPRALVGDGGAGDCPGDSCRDGGFVIADPEPAVSLAWERFSGTAVSPVAACPSRSDGGPWIAET